MSNSADNASPTQYTSDWTRFEECLSELLGDISEPTLNATVRLRYPTGAGAVGEITLKCSFSGDASDTGLEPHGAPRGLGVNVDLPGLAPRFFPLLGDLHEIPAAALHICAFLRNEALVPHPGLLTAEAEGHGERMLEALGLPGHGDGLRELADRNPRNAHRVVADRGDYEADAASPSDETPEDIWPGLAWPETTDEMSEALEEVLTLKYGAATLDLDDEYVINPVGGPRFYLTVINDQPLIAFRKAVVLHVNSRRSAVIEANYLNRESFDIRWVLRGYTLYQEYQFTTAPFVPVRLVEMLDRFGEQYLQSVSALEFRLGGDS